MPRKPKQAAAETPAIEPTPTPAPSANGTETVSGYFRRIFSENPHLLKERSNEAIYGRWLADHPGNAEVPANVKNILQNLKSVLRKQKGKQFKKRDQPNSMAVPHDEPVQQPRPKAEGRPFEQLERQIDECLFAARRLHAEELQKVVGLLRQARNNLIRECGMASSDPRAHAGASRSE